MKTNVKTTQGTNKVVKVQTCTTDLASYSLTQWQFWQLTLKWLSGARAQDKNKQYYCCFFLIFIQLCDSRKIHYLTREFRVKLHLKSDIALIALRFINIGFSNKIKKVTITWRTLNNNSNVSRWLATCPSVFTTLTINVRLSLSHKTGKYKNNICYQKKTWRFFF